MGLLEVDGNLRSSEVKLRKPRKLNRQWALHSNCVRRLVWHAKRITTYDDHLQIHVYVLKLHVHVPKIHDDVLTLYVHDVNLHDHVLKIYVHYVKNIMIM